MPKADDEFDERRLIERIAAPRDDRALSPGSGCVLWVGGLLGSTVVLFLIGIRTGVIPFNLFGPPDTLWETVRSWLCMFGPQATVVIVVLVRAARRHWREGLSDTTGRCQHCGYDLRATPERCPECGTVPAGANGNAEAQRRGGAEKTTVDDAAG